MTISTDDLGRITQQTAVITGDGDRLGTINQIYTSDNTGDPAWVTLKTGMFGTKESFVPLSDATFDGDDIRVPVTKDAVHGAPRVDAGGHLSPDEEDELYRYYNLHNPERPEADTAAGGLHDDRDDQLGHDDDRLGHGDRLGDDDRGGRVGLDDDRDDRFGDGDRDLSGDGSDGVPAAGTGAHSAAGAGTAAAVGAAAAVGGRRRDDEQAERDVEGRDEVADGVPRRTEDDDSDVTARGGDDEAVRPGERTTRLKRYVVTERVVQTVEELPDDDPR
jgi:hypothetical protein